MKTKLYYQPTQNDPEIEVEVYDFIHNVETNDSFVLCWVPKNEIWMTIPIWMTHPIKEKKKLKENIKE